MSIRKKTILKCNRCGKTVAIDDDCFDAVAAVRAAGDGWRHIDSSTDLCGECAKSYFKLKDRQDRELSDFMG